MLNKELVASLVNQALESTDNYLIELKITPSNKIIVLIENDNHVAIKDCISISRFIEQNLDREMVDFELEVSSPGIDQPFKHQRQFFKNIGRAIEIKNTEGEILKGILMNADENHIEINLETTKKNKNLVESNLQLDIKDIKEAKLIIKI